MIPLFLYQNLVSVITRFATNAHERPRTPTNDHEYYHGTTRNDPDPATVELRFRPRPQSNTIHPDEFKRFKLVVALSWRLPNHQESSRITTVLLQWRQPSKSPPVLPLNGELPELYRHRSYLWTERERTILNSGPVHSHRTSVPFRSASFHSKHERPINRLLFKCLFLLSI